VYYIRITDFNSKETYYVGKRGYTFTELSTSCCKGKGYDFKKRAQAAQRRIIKNNEENGIYCKFYSIVFLKEEQDEKKESI